MYNSKAFRLVSIVVLGILSSCSNDQAAISTSSSDESMASTISAIDDKEVVTKLLTVLELRPNRVAKDQKQISIMSEGMNLNELKTIIPQESYEYKRKLNDTETLTVKTNYLMNQNGQHFVLLHRTEEAPNYKYDVDIIVIASLQDRTLKIVDIIDCGNLHTQPRIDNDYIYITSSFDIIPFTALTGVNKFKRGWFSKYYKINQNWNVCNCVYSLSNHQTTLVSFTANLNKVPHKDLITIFKKVIPFQSPNVKIDEYHIKAFISKFRDEFIDYQTACS